MKYLIYPLQGTNKDIVLILVLLKEECSDLNCVMEKIKENEPWRNEYLFYFINNQGKVIYNSLENSKIENPLFYSITKDPTLLSLFMKDLEKKGKELKI